MTPSEFWQNFKLGQEQEIACNFIYDGLKNLHEMETLSQETEVFLVLYYLSVGIERLLKVAVILMEFDDDTDINNFEKSLITHNHLELLNSIKAKKSLPFGDAHIELLSLLSIFYKTHRYDRFNLQSLTSFSKDKKAFLDFLHKHLNIDIKEESSVFYVENTIQIKKFIGKIIKNITKELYLIIKETSGYKNLYTDEISSSNSKAGKILLSDKPIVFEDENIAVIEMLLFFMNTKESSRVDLMKNLKPLQLDPALDTEYLQALIYKRPEEIQSVIDEIEACYADIDNLKERLEVIKVINDPSIYIS